MPALGLSIGLPFGRAAAVAAAPGTPTGFTATAGDQQITLSWDAQPTADTFTITYNTADNEPGASLLTDTATGTSFVFDSGESIQAGEKYYFWITAVNAIGSSASTAANSRAFVTVADSATVNLVTPSGSWMLTTLLFRSGGNLPFGCTVTFDGTSKVAASLGDGTWEDQINLVAPYDEAVSGSFSFLNSTGSSVTFWDTEP